MNECLRKMTTFENVTTDQRIRASLHRDILAVCKESCHCLGLDITRPAMDLVFEIFMEKILCYAEDLEAFARHAKRFIITGDDVRLLARRNKHLRSRLDSIKPPATASTSTKEAPKRRRTVAVTVPPSTPAKKAKSPKKAEDNIDLTDD